MLTLPELQELLKAYEKQFEAANSMLHQASGAIALLNTQIDQLQKRLNGDNATVKEELSDKEYIDKEMQVL